MKALTDSAAALSLVAALPAFTAVGEQHRLANQSSAAVQDTDRRTDPRVTVWHPAKADAPSIGGLTALVPARHTLIGAGDFSGREAGFAPLTFQVACGTGQRSMRTIGEHVALYVLHLKDIGRQKVASVEGSGAQPSERSRIDPGAPGLLQDLTRAWTTCR